MSQFWDKDTEEKLDALIAKCRKWLSEAEFPHCICFRIPGTKNVAYIQTVKSAGSGKFGLHINVGREGSSLWTSHYYAERPEEDMRHYLSSDEDAIQFRKSIEELSESVDDKEGEFPSDY